MAKKKEKNIQTIIQNTTLPNKTIKTLDTTMAREIRVLVFFSNNMPLADLSPS